MREATLKEKVEVYEKFLHKISMCTLCCDNTGLKELISNADAWSYMHRYGNGEISQREQKILINNALLALCDTPKSNLEAKTRQKKYEEHQKENSLRSKTH